MDLNGGYIKLFRKTLDSRVFANAEIFKVWIWCLLRANHKNGWVMMKTGRGETEVRIEPGQFIFGRKAASEELKMPQSSIRNRIKKLKNIGNLDIKEDTHYSIITIVNWDTYQCFYEKEDSKEDNQRTGKGQAKDTNKNEKKEKKETDTSTNFKKNAQIVLDRINELSGKLYRTTKPIEAVMRSKELNATVEDCIKVVEYKWKDEFIREKFFTPESLFRPSKFASKLDEANNSSVRGAPPNPYTGKSIEDLLS